MPDQISHEEQQAWIDAYNDVDWTEWMDIDRDGAEVALPERNGTPALNNNGELVMSPALDNAAQGPGNQLAPTPTCVGNVVLESSLGPDHDEKKHPQQTRRKLGRLRKARQPLTNAIDHNLRCPEAGCTFDGTFPRQYQLNRHISAKHRSKRPFSCPAIGCFKGANVTSFPHSDKLTDHVRKMHAADKLGNCVVHRCTIEPQQLDLLRVHSRLTHGKETWYGRHGYIGSESPHLQALDDALDPYFKRCPYWNCQTRSRVPHREFIGHVLAHTADELLSMNESLLALGYRLVHNASEIGDQDLSLGITCPLCEDQHFHRNDDFEKHVVERHLLRQTPDNISHWRSWYFHVQYRQRDRRDPWNSWHFFGRKTDGPCPTCGHEISGGWDDETHHFDFLRNEEEVVVELYPHRREILRKFPDFWTHPVFNSLKTGVPAE